MSMVPRRVYLSVVAPSVESRQVEIKQEPSYLVTVEFVHRYDVSFAHLSDTRMRAIRQVRQCLAYIVLVD